MDDGAAGRTLTPDDAFSLLGDETRLSILRALGDADGPLAFSELRDRADVGDSGRFNYHLERLVGQFVDRDDGGYYLARPGRRVIEAVLSGAVTDRPELERTAIDQSCGYCGAPVEIAWRAGSVEVYCTDCPGTFGRRGGNEELAGGGGYIGRMPLPPAGLEGRTPEAVHRAAGVWGTLELVAMGAGICPRCSAALAESASACPDHDASAGLCETCDGIHVAHYSVRCTNCIFEGGGDFVIKLLATTPLLNFLLDHGHNPFDPADPATLHQVLADYDEAVDATDPLQATFSFSLDGERLDVTVDGLEVVETSRSEA